MPDREELHELHVDEWRAGAEAQRIAVAAHVDGSAVAPVEPRQPAGGDNGGLRRDHHRRAAFRMPRHRARNLTVDFQQIDHAQVALAGDAGRLVTTVRSVFDTAGPVLRKST